MDNIKKQWISIIKNSEKPKVLLMLSGGKDSTYCLALLKKAGITVEAVMFSHRWAWENSVLEARRAAEHFKTSLTIIDISSEFLNLVSSYNAGRPCRKCKPIMYIKTMEYALKNDFGWICVGDNKSDTIIQRLAEYVNTADDSRNKNLYVNGYLDCIEMGIPVQKELSVVRPIIDITAETVEQNLKHEFRYVVKKNHETGDKYFNYWREGCPIQYTDPGFCHSEDSLDLLKEMNRIATDYAKEHNIRASVHYPSGVIVTVPKGHEDAVLQCLQQSGFLLDKQLNSQNAFQRPRVDHYIIECSVNVYYLNTVEIFEPFAARFAERMNLHIISCNYHQFSPHGVTYVQIISESHVAYHTWPENNYLLIDIVSCKPLPSIDDINIITSEVFKASHISIKRINYEQI